MAASKTASTLLASTSCAASGTQTSSTLNLTTAYGAVIIAVITNGSTAPTIGCTATVNISGDGTNWYQWSQGTGGPYASFASSFAWELPPSAMYAQVVFTGNTGQAVTVIALAEVLTGL